MFLSFKTTLIIMFILAGMLSGTVLTRAEKLDIYSSEAENSERAFCNIYFYINSIQFENETIGFLTYVQFKNMPNETLEYSLIIMNSVPKPIEGGWHNVTYDVKFVHTKVEEWEANETLTAVFSGKGSLYFFGSPYYYPFDTYYFPIRINPVLNDTLVKENVQVDLRSRMPNYVLELLNIEVGDGNIDLDIVLKRNLGSSPVTLMIPMLFMLWGISFLIDAEKDFSTRIRIYISIFLFLISYNQIINNELSYMVVPYCMGINLLNILMFGIVLNILGSAIIKIFSRRNESLLTKYPIVDAIDVIVLVITSILLLQTILAWNNAYYHIFPSTIPNLFPSLVVSSFAVVMPILFFIIGFSLKRALIQKSS